MEIINLNNISISFGVNVVLKDLSFGINEDDKVGIIGVNGAGKSTLFKIISGKLKKDSGDVFISKNKKIGYLEQNVFVASDKTIFEEMMLSYSEIIDIENKLKNIEILINNQKDENIIKTLVDQQSRLSEEFSRLGGYEYRSRAIGILKGLGFESDMFDLSIKSLSGGQKTRLALAMLLARESDILMLDEPTNHLDISSCEWLEGYLKKYSKAVMIISHDRFFLDAVCSNILEIENCKGKIYSGNYSEYINKKEFYRQTQQNQFEIQQKEIDRLNSFIKQQKQWNRERNIIAAESRQKAIDRMEKVDEPESLPEKIRISLKLSVKSGKDVLAVKDLSMGFVGKELFNNISFDVLRHEKVFILGPNGCGKTTLLKILSEKTAGHSGCFQYGTNVKMEYFAQELENLNIKNTVLEEVFSVDGNFGESYIRNLLAAFLFKGKDVFKKVEFLSGGEKSRVSLVKLILGGSNFLILDEPTNHLDINSKEVLEDALMNFEGTLLIVSHDRYFINKIATRIIEIKNGEILDYNGNYSSYLNYRNNIDESASEIEDNKIISISKQEYLTNKELKSKQLKLEKIIKETEKEIYETEERIGQIDLEMLREEVITDYVRLDELSQEKSRLSDELETLYDEWGQL